MKGGKCIARKENNIWKATCFPDGEEAKTIKTNSLEELREYSKKNNLQLEIKDKLKMKEVVFEELNTTQ